jgi:ABC-type transport system substrate-binding protein
MARNTEWWGSERGLGPAIEQLELSVVPSADEHVDELVEGTVQVAGELDAGKLRRIRDDPLLTAVTKPGGLGLGAERSVRGIPAGGGAPPLNAVWLTRIRAAGTVGP